LIKFSRLVYEHLSGRRGALWFRSRVLFRLTEPLVVTIVVVGEPLVIVVPVGFVCDGASVPWYFQWRFRSDGPWAEASWLHNFLYAGGKCTRLFADMLFLVAMFSLGVRGVDAWLMCLGVRLSSRARKSWSRGNHGKGGGCG